MQIGCDITDTGLRLRIDDRAFAVTYPGDVWREFPHKEAFADNYAFIKTLHLPWMLPGEMPLRYATHLPQFRHSLFTAMLNNVPFAADMDRVPAGEQVRRLLAQDIDFANWNVRPPAGGKPLRERAVVNMSFGKDSLLTWAVARELGLDPVLYYTVEADCPREYAYKAEIAARFSAEFGETVHVVENETGVIHRPKYWGVPHTEWGFGHLITEHAMHAIPFAWAHGARYILLGNEKECDDTYTTHDGFKSWPVYDQTSEWALELTNIARGLTGSQMEITSIIKPLYQLAITLILHKRFPEAAKYQMSCFPDENDHGRDSRWCGHCTKCARNFAFMHAVGVDPRLVGLQTDMFQRECLDYFTRLSAGSTNVQAVAGDATPCSHDQQLFSLLLAHERGARGPVMDVFAANFLNEARARRVELHTRFYTVHPARSISAPLLERINRLYADALRNA